MKGEIDTSDGKTVRPLGRHRGDITAQCKVVKTATVGAYEVVMCNFDIGVIPFGSGSTLDLAHLAHRNQLVQRVVDRRYRKFWQEYSSPFVDRLRSKMHIFADENCGDRTTLRGNPPSPALQTHE